ncbi:hypothetical protein [Roseospira visakhapatnamensis]|uniref:Uncharacterized protein n=1 Tax=Roseospira visakhapatnamensis TaxID=390880 RepID=A0A7W6RBK2_9PROT|nr:hypothetical protein [Roseospira visakhapatnamensis]MBB4265478.1 hypothetical protein [Roseospira visakhapatnamensis]
MSFLSFLFGDAEKPPPDPYWQRDDKARFFRLLALKTTRRDLAGRGGVFVVFHGGVQPRWVYVGSTANLGATVMALQDHPDLTTLEARGGLFMTWAYIKADKRDGVVTYLRARMKPELDPSDLDKALGCAPKGARPQPVQLPG